MHIGVKTILNDLLAENVIIKKQKWWSDHSFPFYKGKPTFEYLMVCFGLFGLNY